MLSFYGRAAVITFIFRRVFFFPLIPLFVPTPYITALPCNDSAYHKSIRFVGERISLEFE